MSISIGLWRVNLSVMGAVSSIARLLKGARCPTVRWFMVFLTLACYSFEDNRLITDIEKPLQLGTVTVFHPKQTKDLILNIPDSLS